MDEPCISRRSCGSSVDPHDGLDPGTYSKRKTLLSRGTEQGVIKGEPHNEAITRPTLLLNRLG